MASPSPGGSGACSGQDLPHALAGPVDALAVEPAVGAGEVDELEQAEGWVDAGLGEGAQRAAAAAVDDHHLPRVELADHVGTDDVEGRGLRGEDPAVVELAQAEGPEPVGVAHADEVVLVHQHQREGALEARQHDGEGVLDIPSVRGHLGRDQLGHQVAVARHRAGQHAGLLGQGLGVDQVAVVAEGELRGAAAVDGLGVAPGARPRGRVAGVADGEVAGQRGQAPVVEHVGDESHVLVDHDGLAVAHGHTGRLLATVLQGVQAEVGEVGHRLTRGVDPEDPARFLRGVGVRVDVCFSVDFGGDVGVFLPGCH